MNEGASGGSSPGQMPSAAPSRTRTHADSKSITAFPGGGRNPTFARDRTPDVHVRASPRPGSIGNLSCRLYGRTGSKDQAFNSSLTKDLERRNERP